MFPSRLVSVLGGGAGFENNYSLEFDGTDDYVECGTNSSLQITAALTISCWFNTDNTDDRQGLVVYSNGGSGPYILTYGVTNGKIEFWQTGSGVNAVSDSTLAADTWHHVVVTREGSSGDWDIKIYLDGSLDSTTEAVSVDASINGTCVIGRLGSHSGYYYDGHIDEVGIWNAVLDADNVAAIYNSNSPMDLSGNSGNYDKSSNLQGYWRFEEGSGTSATDRSTNSNTGTLTNGTAYSTDLP